MESKLPLDKTELNLLDQKIDANKNLTNVKLREIRRALKLQAKEYKRRLEALNHEAAQLRKMQETYIPREVFDRTMNDLKKDMEINSQWRIKQEGQGMGRDTYTKYIPWLLTFILSIVIAYLAYNK